MVTIYFNQHWNEQKKRIKIKGNRRVRCSERPTERIAVNSKLSERLPKTIKEVIRMAIGKASRNTLRDK